MQNERFLEHDVSETFTLKVELTHTKGDLKQDYIWEAISAVNVNKSKDKPNKSTFIPKAVVKE